MTAIDERHTEWATVDRMRDMLASVRRDYQVTQTYTLFASILCWTLQRIRSEDDGSEVVRSLRRLKSELEQERIADFSRSIRPAGRPTPVRDDLRSSLLYNDLSGFGSNDAPSSSLGALVAMRNAVAHGDARRIIPENNGPTLRGYTLLCRPDPKAERQWAVDLLLDARGMRAISDELAERFCASVISPEDRQRREDARQMRERA